MEQQPEPPREDAREAAASAVARWRNGGRWSPARRSPCSGTAVVGLPAMRAQDVASPTRAPICLAAGATPGTGLPSCSMLARSPATNTSGRAGSDRSGATRTRPARSSSAPGVTQVVCRAARPRRRRPRGWCARRCARRRARGNRRPDSVTGAPVRTSTPSCTSCLRAFSDSSSVNAASTRGPASISSTRALRGSMWRKSSHQRVPRDFRERAGELDAGRARADHREREAGVALGVVGRGFGALERGQARGAGSRMRRRAS